MALVFDPIRSSSWDYEVERTRLASRGVLLAVPEDEARAVAALPDADVVVVSSRLPSHHLESMRSACGIVCYSVGMDGVDLVEAAARGLEVVNVPGYCTEEVSDHALALLFAAQRHIVPLAVAAAAGRWQVHRDLSLAKIWRMSSLTIGIVGAGRIGSRVAAKCHALGMSILIHDPFVQVPSAVGIEQVLLDSLLERSDAVILCAALTQTTHSLIDSAALDRMRSDAILVNVARGQLVDEVALSAALRSGRLRAAALDVRRIEPPPPDDPLRQLPNVILTQHLAARSVEAHADLHRIASDQIIALLERAGRLSIHEGMH